MASINHYMEPLCLKPYHLLTQWAVQTLATYSTRADLSGGARPPRTHAQKEPIKFVIYL